MSVQFLFMPCVASIPHLPTSWNRKLTHLGQPKLILILNLDKRGPFVIPNADDRRRGRYNLRAAHNGLEIVYRSRSEVGINE